MKPVRGHHLHLAAAGRGRELEQLVVAVDAHTAQISSDPPRWCALVDSERGDSRVEHKLGATLSKGRTRPPRVRVCTVSRGTLTACGCAQRCARNSCAKMVWYTCRPHSCLCFVR